MKTTTQFKYLLAFELSLFFKRVWIYIVLLAFLGLGFVGGSSFSAFTTENTFRNSPFAITYILGYLSLFCIFTSSMLAAQVLFREQEHHFSMVLYATPLKKLNFFLSRFLVVFGITAFTLFLLVIGFAIGQQMSRFDASEFGPFHFWYYFQPFLLLTVPNTFFCSAVVCSIGLLTKNKLLVYISGLFIFIAYQVTLIFSGSPLIAGGLPPTEESMQMAAQFDPFGLSAFLHQTLLWSAIQRNTTVVALTGIMLFNRVFYIAFSFLLLITAHRLFRFSVDGKSKNVKETTKVKTTLLPYRIVLPQVFSFSHQAQSLLSLVKIDLTFVLKSIPFVLILIGIVFFVSMEMYGEIEQGIRIPENYVSTGLMVNTILETFPALCTMVILFYSNELLWRSRSSNFHLIENTTPANLFVRFVAKWFSMTCIILLLITGVVITGIVFQIVYQYPHIEFDTYIYIGYLAGLPLIFSSGIIIAIQQIIRNRYVGLIAATAFVLLTTTSIGTAIHIKHPLLRIGSAFGGEYSAMNGYGAYLTLFNWKMLFGICATFIIVLLIVQLQQKNKRLWKLSTTLSLLAFLLIAITSGFFVNNRLEITDEESTLRWQANYEKKYRAFQNLPKPDIKAVKTSIDLFPERNAYQVSATYILQNSTNQPINKLLFYLDPEISLKNLKVAHLEVSEADSVYGHYWISLDKPLQPHDSIKASFAFSYVWNAFSRVNSFNAIVENGAFMRISNYFPQLGYQSGNEIAHEVERKTRNLGKATPHKSLEAPREEAAEWLSIDMQLSTSANQIAIGVGELMKQWKANNRNYFHYKTDMPVRFRFGVSSADYVVRKVQHRGIGIEVYYHPAHSENVDGLITNAKNTLDYCETNFGKYPFKTIRFAEISAFSKGFAATAYPATIFMTENMVFHANVKGDKQQDVINELAGHELSHEWWGSTQFVPDEREGGRFLSETFAMYTELMLVKRMYGQKRVLENVRMHKNIYLSDRGFSDEQPLYKTNYSNLHQFYSKGMVTMYQLSELIGEDKVNKALRNIYQKYAGSNTLPITTDFLDEVYTLTDTSLHPAIDDLFKKIIIYQPVAQSIKTKQVGNQYETSFEVIVNKYREDGMGKQTLVDFSGTIEIGFSFKDGKPQVISFPIVHNKTNIKISHAEKPLEMVLDPNEKMIKIGDSISYRLK
ncbi:M1 family aminopeptidase [Emticicia sp. C21]|uniref:ABC transporter permease/M1 family aminopeptidase n=1 Tax=Emticicia sp. C21 TaxID=2302915 RepID=UPI000E3534D2|nr:M1 family aminopeptidase [Emticicia sp. C21]RFS15011.1 aminopeptidase [Emticicia sp. C21]